MPGPSLVRLISSLRSEHARDAGAVNLGGTGHDGAGGVTHVRVRAQGGAA